MPVATTHTQDAHGLILGRLNSGVSGHHVQQKIKRKLRGEKHVTASTVSHFESSRKPGVAGDVIAAMLDTNLAPHTVGAHNFVERLERWAKALRDANGQPVFKRVDHW